MPRVLVIEDDDALRMAIRKGLAASGHDVTEAGSVELAKQSLASDEFDLVLTDINLDDGNGLDLVREIRAEGFIGPVVVMTAYGTVERAVEAMRAGADDFLQKPIEFEELPVQIESWITNRKRLLRLSAHSTAQAKLAPSDRPLGESDAWKSTLETVERFVRVPLPPEGGGTMPCFLLLGETGAGKGVLARYIHERAVQSSGGDGTEPFIHVNCSALPPTLVESELFGHERGAFTDAREAKPGLFELADGGTIFLDEISETPLAFQAKLLTVLEHGTLRRVGGQKERAVRVRIVTASNQDLLSLIQKGGFRSDLYYRLDSFTIGVPALRERGRDSVLLAEHFLERLSREYGRPRLEFDDDALDAIESHPWRGNVRELLNAVQRAAILVDDNVVTLKDLALRSGDATEQPEGIAPESQANSAPSNGRLSFDFEGGACKAEEIERELIRQAIEHERGNVSRAAKLIGMTRAGLRYRIERHGLDEFVKEVSRR